jgi:anaerobic magnesium-protoporphyrin IX monomethyl ester cyclase
LKKTLRITFVGIGWEQLSISLLSSLAKGLGHETRLAFSVALFNDRYNFSIEGLSQLFDDRKEVIEQIRNQRPDILAFSPLTSTYQWMLGVAQEAKQVIPEVKTIFGGVHVSAVPERAISQPAVDYLCIGEGDVAFPRILQAIKIQDEISPLPNTWFKNSNGQLIRGPQVGFLQDLDSLPIFDKILWEDHMHLGGIYFTIASRGCPFQCVFCFNSYFASLAPKTSGKYIRHRSPEHLLGELQFARRRYRPQIFEFEDDVFTINKPWLKKFLELYKTRIRTPFQCLTNPRFVDEDIVRWLADAGCQYIQMGIQSMDDEYKRKSLNRFETTASVETALALFRKYRIKVKVDHMFGLPQEPLQAQEKARELYLKHPPYRIQTFWTNYFPGTPLMQKAVELELLSEQDVEKILEGRGKDFYRMSQSAKGEKGRGQTHLSYEVIFKLLQILPARFVRILSPRIFAVMPPSICRLLSFIVDVISGLIKGNPDHREYAGYYLSQTFRFFLRKFSIKVSPATRVYENIIIETRWQVDKMAPDDKALCSYQLSETTR